MCRVIDKWCHLKNLGLEDFFVGVSKYSEEEKKNYNQIIYGTYLNNFLATLSDDQGIINQNKSTCICIA